MKELSAKLKKLEIDKSPFVNNVDIKAKKHWAKPELVGEFDKSIQTTKSGTIRHPAIFVGLRSDKKPKDVVEENALPPKEIKDTAVKEAHLPISPIKRDVTDSWETLDKRSITSENNLKVEGHTIPLVNIEKEMWPGVTKADVIQYYISVERYILPHLKDRPLGLNIVLDSPVKGGFFIRGMEGRAPSWADIFTTERKHKKKVRVTVSNGLCVTTQPRLFT